MSEFGMMVPAAKLRCGDVAWVDESTTVLVDSVVAFTADDEGSGVFGGAGSALLFGYGDGARLSVRRVDADMLCFVDVG